MRIAFDLDGVLADFAGAYDALTRRLLSRPATGVLALSGTGSSAGTASSGMERRIWREIQSADDFWTTLDPIEPDLIASIHERAVQYRWDIFFVTQRPATAGDGVQRQTQRWLVEHGFPMPAVIVHASPRRQLAVALELDFLVDDAIEHCVDVLDVSPTRPLFVCRKPDTATETNAERLGIAICRSATEALKLIVEQQPRRTRDWSLLRRPGLRTRKKR